jgi:hypothetical protein
MALLEARHPVPVMYNDRESTVAGGVMSCGAALAETFCQVGLYTGRILGSEKAAINLSVPPTVRALATEVIE